MATKPKQTWGGFGKASLAPSVPAGKYGYMQPLRTQPVTTVPGGGANWGKGYGSLPGGADFDTPGYTPDYAALISGDYEYQGALGAYGAADIQDEAQLNETIGGLNQSFESQKLDLGRQLARGNAQGDVDLAARGTLGSGALAVLRGALNESHTKALNQAGEVRAQGERAARGSYASNVAARAAQLAALRASVASRLMQDPRYQPSAGGTAKWNAGIQGYVDDNGNVYNADRSQQPNTVYGGSQGAGPARVDAKGNVWAGGQIVYKMPVAPAMRKRK